MFTDYLPGNLARDVMKDIAVLSLKNHHITSRKIPKLKKGTVDEPVDPQIDIFYTKSPDWHLWH
jgi:hypothetical protein